MKKDIILKNKDKFLKKVNKTDSCWLWKGAKSVDGYGTFYLEYKTVYSHRFSYSLHVGDIPDGMCVCHNCPNGDNKLCVNPEHLFLGSVRTNIVDYYNKNMHKGKMKGQEVQFRIRLSDELHKEFKIFCLHNDLSMNAQTVAIIENFLQIQKDNVKIQRQLRKMEKIKNDM